jgi:hypothetical protein
MRIRHHHLRKKGDQLTNSPARRRNFIEERKSELERSQLNSRTFGRRFATLQAFEAAASEDLNNNEWPAKST